MRVLLGFVLLLSMPAGAQTPTSAAPRVGLASVVERRAEANRDGTVRTLVLRDALFRNERLSTGDEPGTKLHVRLLDQTVITLGPSSDAVLDDFAINPEAGTAEVSLKLSRGVLRFVGGKHADTGTRYQVRTPVATIGVRGTAFNLKVDESGGTTVQLTEGELAFANEDGIEVILDEPLETSSLDDEDDAPSEPEVDEALAEEFDELDLSDEEEAIDGEIAEELDDEDLEVIDGEDPDDFDGDDDFDVMSDDTADTGDAEGDDQADEGDSDGDADLDEDADTGDAEGDDQADEGDSDGDADLDEDADAESDDQADDGDSDADEDLDDAADTGDAEGDDQADEGDDEDEDEDFDDE